MTELAATATPGPGEARAPAAGFWPMRWPALLVLVSLVVLAHTWVLDSAPGRISAAGGSAQAPPLVMRRVEPPPPAPAPALAARPPEPVAASPAPKPVIKPASKQKAPPADVERAQAATELIAQPEPPPGTPPPPDAGVNAAADATAATAAVAATNNLPPAPTVAASAPAALPSLPETTAVTAMTLPASVELKYKATGLYKGLTYHATSELSWQHDGTSYNARLSVAAFLVGSRVLSSTGQVGTSGLAPTRFADKARSEVAAHFDADKAQVSFSANTPTVPWIPGTQDRASVFIQLAGMLAGNPAAFPAGSSISLYTVGPRSADVWTFTVEAEETISLPAGEMKVVKLTQKPRGEYDRKAELWLAPALGYLPVRNKITQADGDFVDQQLSGVTRF
jgi:hypothetical protein